MGDFGKFRVGSYAQMVGDLDFKFDKGKQRLGAGVSAARVEFVVGVGIAEGRRDIGAAIVAQGVEAGRLLKGGFCERRKRAAVVFDAGVQAIERAGDALFGKVAARIGPILFLEDNQGVLLYLGKAMGMQGIALRKVGKLAEIGDSPGGCANPGEAGVGASKFDASVAGEAEQVLAVHVLVRIVKQSGQVEFDGMVLHDVLAIGWFIAVILQRGGQQGKRRGVWL